MFFPSGVISALATPFRNDKKINKEAIIENIKFQKEAGVKGICVLGGTGEPMSLSVNERKEIMNVTVKASNKSMDLVAGALIGNPKEVENDIIEAKKAGFHACLVCPPPFVCPSEKDVESYFTELSSIGMPLIIFNTPSRSGFLMKPELIAKLTLTLENVVGIKEASGNLLEVAKLIESCPKSFSILQGEDSLYFLTLALGGNGGILAAAAVIPEVFIKIQEFLEQGNIEKARILQCKIIPFVNLMYEASHPAPLKIAMEIRGLPAGPTRPPLYGLSHDHYDRVKKTIKLLLKDLKNILID